MARKWSDGANPVVTDLIAGDKLLVLRESDGANGSKIILIEDFIDAFNLLEGKHQYSMGGQMLEIQAGNAIIMGNIPPVDITIPTAGNLSCGIAKFAATGITVFTIRKNGTTSIGTMSFVAAGTVPVFNFPSDVTILGGIDYVEVLNPASPDATLNGLYFSIWGRR